MVNTKHAFWMAFFFTLAVFLIGLLVGIFVENARADNIQNVLLDSEINLLDEQLKENAIQEFNISCNLAKNSTFNFADKIYEEALRLEKYDSASKMKDTLTIFHKRYDLLRILLWTNSMKIRSKCHSDFHTIVYLYDYDTRDISKKAEQIAMSNLLLDFKYKYPQETLLIPIAANLNIESINLIKEEYNVTNSPVIIIDESMVIRSLPTFNGLENIVFQSNNK